MNSFENKVSFITGAARGIGKAIAERLAKAGSDIAICDVNPESLAPTHKELESLGRKVISDKVDVTDFQAVFLFVEKILDKFGKIDILVNNAGITRDGLLIRMSDEDWDRVLDVNLKGAFNCLKAVARPMMKARYGKIINIASVIGIMGNAGQANYAASKGGLIALTKTAAKELASRNITVNAVAPGFIQTDMTAKLTDDLKNQMLKFIPLGQLGTAAHVADTVAFLAGEDSAYITGQVIQVDGGMVM